MNRKPKKITVSDDNKDNVEAELYVFYISEGMSKDEAYLKIKPQHKGKDKAFISRYRYSYEKKKLVQEKLRKLSMSTYLQFQNEHLNALKKQYEIGIGIHGGSLKTQADALHQFIQNTANPNTKLKEEDTKELQSNKELLDSISNLFNSIGKTMNKDIEEVEIVDTTNKHITH